MPVPTAPAVPLLERAAFIRPLIRGQGDAEREVFDKVVARVDPAAFAALQERHRDILGDEARLRGAAHRNMDIA